MATLAAGVLAALGCAAGGGSGGLAGNTPESRAGQLLRHRCQGCHQAPRAQAMTGAAWRSALTRMRRRVTLPAADWDSLAALGAPDTTGTAR